MVNDRSVWWDAAPLLVALAVVLLGSVGQLVVGHQLAKRQEDRALEMWNLQRANDRELRVRDERRDLYRRIMAIFSEFVLAVAVRPGTDPVTEAGNRRAVRAAGLAITDLSAEADLVGSIELGEVMDEFRRAADDVENRFMNGQWADLHWDDADPPPPMRRLAAAADAIHNLGRRELAL